MHYFKVKNKYIYIKAIQMPPIIASYQKLYTRIKAYTSTQYENIHTANEQTIAVQKYWHTDIHTNKLTFKPTYIHR